MKSKQSVTFGSDTTPRVHIIQQCTMTYERHAISCSSDEGGRRCKDGRCKRSREAIGEDMAYGSREKVEIELNASRK